MDISLEYYKTFYYVAKNQSFSKAAKAMQKGQPNITKPIQTLEGQLGCQLFNRTAKGAVLTPEGERLYVHIAKAMEHIMAGESELILDRSLKSGTITLATGDISLRSCLLPAIETYRLQHPQVNIRLFNFSSAQAIEAVTHHLVDMAVVTAPDILPNSLSNQTIVRFRQVLVCGRAYAHLVGTPLTLEEVAAYPLVSLHQQTATHQFLADVFHARGVPYVPAVEAATADQILPLIRSNLGLGFVPEFFYAEEARKEGLFLLDVADPIPQQSTGLIKRKDSQLTVAAKELERILLQQRN